ncbi:MAG TPA: phospholipase D-like domain-containing protein [Kofleriaceae bacterium]|nr:phospholipase D-like domain-containing protein [Kofleriaceae bacterium]
MRPRPSVALVLALALLGACRADNGNGDDQPSGDAGIDAPSGPGCTMTSPRTVAPETFVGPTGLQPRLTQMIDSAQTSLDLHMYLWTVRALADRVVAAKNRGVDVRIILDPDHAGNDAVRPTLSAGGVNVRNNISLYSFAHAKYMIIDGDTAVIMSMNFNVDAMNSERNYGMVDRDPDDVADVQAIFDMDWAAAGAETPKPADLACTRLVVSPNNARSRLVELIDGAQDTLELQIMYLAEDTVRAAVGAAKQRGVNVRVMIGDDTDESIPYLKGLGIPVKTATQFYLHAKLIVADGVVFVGSENMSLTSLTKNREVGALVYEPGAADPIKTQFESDWNSAPSL